MKIPVHRQPKNHAYILWREFQIRADIVESPHRHDYYQIMFLEQVKGKHEIDFNTYPALPCAVHFVGLSCVHKVDFEENIKGGVLIFPASIFGESEAEKQLQSSLSF